MPIRPIVLVCTALITQVAAAAPFGDYANWGTVKGRGHGAVRIAPVLPRPLVRRDIVALGKPAVTGAIDAVIIRRYIRREIPWLTYCYEKELLARPKLSSGSLTVTFEISPDGIIRSAAASGIDRVVAGCVVTVIAGIEFPNPKRGTVTVTLPIKIFSSNHEPDVQR